MTEGRRRRLFEAAARTLGTEEAETLMELVPAGLEPATRTDLLELRTDLKGDIAAVRTEMAELRTELKGDIAAGQRQMLATLLVVTLTHIGVTAALLSVLR
ncbi:MAG: hypothetical protein RLZZ272_1465 [Actinomycetota bacterium]